MGRRTGKNEILLKLISRALKGGEATAVPTSSWGDDPSDLDGDRPTLSQKDAEPLVKAGLLLHHTSGSVHYSLTPEGIRRAVKLVPSYERLDVEAVVRDVLDDVLFHPSAEIGGEVAVPALYSPGKSRLVLVLGENGGGKSLFRRLVRATTHPGRKAEYGEKAVPRGRFPVREFLGLSMELRSSGGMTAALMFGSEGWLSTGSISADMVTKGIKTARERTHTTVLYWDEPDIGMSPGSAAGAGVAIRRFVESDDAPLVQAVFLTSHREPLIRQLAPLEPHYVYVGDPHGPPDLDAWFEAQRDPRPITPEELKAASGRRFDLVRTLLNARRRD